MKVIENYIYAFYNLFNIRALSMIGIKCKYKGETKWENEPNLDTISGVGALSLCASTSSGADTNVTDLPDETKIRAQEPQIADTSSQKFACDHCSKTFPSASRLKSHMTKDHKENSSNRFPCPECDWTGKTAGVMKTHIKKKHM